MKRKYLRIAILLAAAGTFGMAACEKTMQEYRNAKPKSEVPVSTYQFLKQQGGLYDTLLLLIDKLHLADTLDKAELTFFVPQDVSIRTAMENLNFARTKLERNGNWTMDSVPYPVWDTLVRRYILGGIVDSDSMRYADGASLVSLYGRAMNGRMSPTNASGIVGGGTELAVYTDKNESRFAKDWTSAYTQNVDVKTTNGMVHILESKHVFGFVSFVGMAFPESLLPRRGPWLGYAIKIPGIVEAADYDEGRDYGYHDNDKNNNGGRYRGDEVDIENCAEGRGDGESAGGDYNIGWTGSGEWMQYTVEVAETGTYEVEFRFAGPGEGGPVHLWFDGKDLTGPVKTPNTGGYQNWQGTKVNVKLTAGKHLMRFTMDGGGFNIHRYIFKKL